MTTAIVRSGRPGGVLVVALAVLLAVAAGAGQAVADASREPGTGVVCHVAARRCVARSLRPAPAALALPSGWTTPVSARVGDGFRPPQRPDHFGVDLEAGRDTPVRAVSAGVVAVAECDPATGDCDRDGSEGVAGCGWYVVIAHPDGVATRYCHLVRRPVVAAGQPVATGQVIGYVGTSGNSSGPHLHFEVHTGLPVDHANAIDPVPFMRAHGAPLGG